MTICGCWGRGVPNQVVDQNQGARAVNGQQRSNSLSAPNQGYREGARLPRTRPPLSVQTSFDPPSVVASLSPPLSTGPSFSLSPQASSEALPQAEVLSFIRADGIEVPLDQPEALIIPKNDFVDGLRSKS